LLHDEPPENNFDELLLLSQNFIKISNTYNYLVANETLMSLFNFSFSDWLTRRREGLTPKIEVPFQCTNCRRRFKRKVRRLYIDLNILDQRQLSGRRPKRSEFVIPQRITCPKCKVVDTYEIGTAAHQYLASTALVVTQLPNPRSPIQCIRFHLLDGRPMHPVEALEYYGHRVEREPINLALRIEYANTLRMLGYLDKAEIQYQKILEQAPTEPNALLNLALFHDRREDYELAIAYFTRLVGSASDSPYPDHDLFTDAVEQILAGKVRPSEIELTAPGLFAISDLARVKQKVSPQKA
jgi:tetratricopeptide (TPR) repeat protein